MAYPNGEVPLSKLVKVGDTYLFPGTARRWAAFVAEVKKETGVTLRITPKQNGASNGYRSRPEQRAIRKVLGVMAAVEGTSSHGGRWTGQTKGHSGIPTWVSGMETGAIDVQNYWEIPWATFKRIAEKHGFIVDITVPTELWHIVDPDPWGKNLKEIDMATLDDEDKKWLRENIGWERKSAVNGLGFGDMVRVTYDSIRYGKKGVRTHGEGMNDILTRLGTLQLQVEAQSVTIQELAKAKGGDPAADLKAVTDAMDKLKVTLSVDAG